MEDWPDWYQLAPAFVAAYGSEELQDLEGAAEFLRAVEEDEEVSLTERDRTDLPKGSGGVARHVPRDKDHRGVAELSSQGTPGRWRR
jgi:hypothetical protein